MIPYLTNGLLNRMPEKRRKKICECSTPCNEFITISTENEDVMLCAAKAKEFAFEILEKVGTVTKNLAFPPTKWGWTTEQERILIKFLKEESCYSENGKVKYGTYKLLGELLGKSRSAINDKVKYLRRMGRL